MFDQLPDLHFKILVIIPKYSRIAELTYTPVIPLMMQFLVLNEYRLIHEVDLYMSIYSNNNLIGYKLDRASTERELKKV